MHCETVTILDFDQHVEGRRRASFQHRFLGAASTRFLIRQGDRFDPTDQIAQGRVEQQVIKGLTMCRADQLYAALGDRASGSSFELAPDLVDDDHFRVVILYRFDHHLVLKHRLAYLHATRLAHGRMRYISVAANFIGRIHNDNTFRFGQDTRGLT